MARNGSGTYVLPAGNPVVTGGVISSTWANNTFNDVASALTGSIATDGQTSPTAALTMAGFNHTNVGVATLRSQYATAGQVQDSAATLLSGISGTNTIVATAPLTMSAYATGQTFTFISAANNTGAVTININAIGAKAITKGGAVALVSGDISAGVPYQIYYDGTQFQLLAVTYVPSGTGAVTTTVQNKLRETLSVKDFGAKGDGTTDDTTAIQAALTAGAGNKVYFPTGTYKVTSTLTISTGTSIEFNGNNAVINYTGTGACLQAASVKHITIFRPNIVLSSADSAAIGIQFLGGWFIKIDHPIITGVTGQTGINIVSSNTGALGWGSYMIEIFQSYFNGMTYGIKTSKQTSDTVSNTHISVYDGWGNNTLYPLYFRNVNTFNIYGFTPESCTDGINLASCSSGLIHLGEADYSGYAVNFPDNTCSGISVFLPSLAGTGTAVNTTNYTPNLYLSNSIRLNGNPSGATNNYYYTMSSVFSYGQSMLETVNGGGFDRNLRTYDDVKLQRLYNVSSISSGGVVGTNLRGTATFSSATTKAVVFGTAEPDASYYVTLGGNAAGYCWITSKTTSGFTINCSSSNSNAVDWILIR